MKKKVCYILLAIVLAAAAVVAAVVLTKRSAPAQDTVVLRLRDSSFTEGQILRRMELTCRKYNLTLDDLRDDPTMWNKLAEDVVYEYAGAEIVTDLAQEYGLAQLSESEQAQVQERARVWD